MKFDVRVACVADFPEVARLWNSAWPNRLNSSAQMTRDLETLEQAHQPVYWLAFESDTAVGAAVVQHDLGSYHPRRWMIEVVVDGPNKGHGVGRSLYEACERWIVESGADSCMTRVAEDDPVPIGFAESRGYKELKRDFESELSLDSANLPGASVPVGVTIQTFASCDSERTRREMHRVFELVRVDIPRSAPPIPLSFEFFLSNIVTDPSFDGECTHLAWLDGRIVGLSTCFRSDAPGRLEQGLTAVVRELRGQGLATALKLSVIAAAAAKGYATIVTDNDTRNAAMLAINDALGFRRLGAVITLEKRFGPEP